MDFSRVTTQNIEKFGSTVTLKINDKEYVTKAFIQPLRYKNKMYVDGYYLPQGYINGSHFLYIGKAEPKFTQPLEDVTITLNKTGEKYTVKRAETYRLKDVDLYMWAVITPKVLELEV